MGYETIKTMLELQFDADVRNLRNSIKKLVKAEKEKDQNNYNMAKEEVSYIANNFSIEPLEKYKNDK